MRLQTTETQRKFAGLLIGSQWYSHDHQQAVEVRSVNIDEFMDIDYLSVDFRVGEQPVDDFMTMVRVGTYEPQNAVAHDATEYAREKHE